MNISTKGFNYYPNYTLQMSIMEGISSLGDTEASDYYKVIFIKSGTAHFEMNDKEFIISGAGAICMNELDRITFFDVKEEEIKILYFHPKVVNVRFSYDLLNSPDRQLSSTEFQDIYFLNQFSIETDTSSKILSLHTIDSTGIDYKLKIINELMAKQETCTWPCRSRSYLFEILFCLARQEDDEKTGNRMLVEGGSRLIKDVIYYLQSCYNKKITIEQLAEVFHTNRTTLYNDFKNYTGQTINRYLIELRLKMASTMLRDTELSVDEICDRTGFSDISYFSKVFKKKLYLTPSKYRRIAHSE